MHRDPIPAIALAGPTASGKTAAAFAIAEALAPRLPVEIISVDSCPSNHMFLVITLTYLFLGSP